MGKRGIKKLIFTVIAMLFINDIIAQKEPLFTEKPNFVKMFNHFGKFNEVTQPKLQKLYKVNDSIRNDLPIRNFLIKDNVRSLVEMQDSIFLYVSEGNILFYMPNGDNIGLGMVPLTVPSKINPSDKISAMYLDINGDMFIGTYGEDFYIVKEDTAVTVDKNDRDTPEDSISVPEKKNSINKILLAPQTVVLSFAQDRIDKNVLWVGTNHGLYRCSKVTGESKVIRPINNIDALSFAVTHIEVDKQNNLWFSTLEKGMGFYYLKKNLIRFYSYPKKIIMLVPYIQSKHFATNPKIIFL